MIPLATHDSPPPPFWVIVLSTTALVFVWLLFLDEFRHALWRRLLATVRFVGRNTVLYCAGIFAAYTACVLWPTALGFLGASPDDSSLLKLYFLPIVFMVVSLILTRSVTAEVVKDASAHGDPEALRRLTGNLVVLWATGLAVFAAATDTLEVTSLVTFEQAEPSHFAILGFYAWHFLDAIPGLGIPETLDIPAPLTYSGASIGLIVLAYKAVALIPLIAGATVVWRFKHAIDLDDDARDHTDGEPVEAALRTSEAPNGDPTESRQAEGSAIGARE